MKAEAEGNARTTRSQPVAVWSPRYLNAHVQIETTTDLSLSYGIDPQLRSISALLAFLTSLILPSSIPYQLFCRILEAPHSLVNLTTDEAKSIYLRELKRNLKLE